MKWDDSVKVKLTWSQEIAHYDEKQQAAKIISAKVKDGDVIGFGSGSTSYLAVLEIGKKVKEEHLKIKAIPTSREIAFVCNELGIPVTSINDERPDWSFDGADEVDPDRNLIKGRGGAMFIEKLIIRSALKSYILADASKFVNYLGSNFPIPVEVFPEALTYVKLMLTKMGAAEIVLRPAKGKDGPIITENGNLILDVRFKDIKPSFENDLKSITGVIETGLFIGYPVEIIKVV